MPNLQAARGPLLLAATILIAVCWPWFLSLLFYWGDSIRGVAASLFMLITLSALFRPHLGALVALACMLALAQGLLVPDSRARREWLFQSKRQQIRSQRLAYSPHWGWVDRRHGLAEVLQQLTPGGERHITHTFFGSWGHYYRLRVQVRIEQDHQAWSALRQIGEACEAQEAHLPWYTAAPLSAYNPDDLPSLYWTIFSQAHPDLDWEFFTAEESETLWNQQGRQFLRLRVRRWKDFLPQSPGLRAKYQQFFAELEPVKLEYRIEGPLPL